MMRAAFLIVLFILVLAGTVLANAPLGFVLEKAGAKQVGLNWAGANGNWRNGSVSDVQFAGQPIGNVKLTLKPMAFLSGKIAYEVDWQGPPGQATGKVSLGKNAMQIDALSGQLKLEALRYLADEVRGSGARLTVQNAQLSFVDGACQNASGQVSSDVLTRMAAPYRQEASVFMGDVVCVGDMLEVSGAGTIGPSGDVSSVMRLGMKEVSSLRAEVFGVEIGLGIALLDYGFEPDADRYIFEHTFQLAEGLQ